MKGDIEKYRQAPGDRDHDQWLAANAVIASLFAAALIGMAIFAALAPAPTQSADQDGRRQILRQAEEPARPALVLEDVAGTLGRGSMSQAPRP